MRAAKTPRSFNQTARRVTDQRVTDARASAGRVPVKGRLDCVSRR